MKKLILLFFAVSLAFQIEIFAQDEFMISPEDVRHIGCKKHLVTYDSGYASMSDDEPTVKTDFHGNVPAAQYYYFVELSLKNGHRQFLAQNKKFTLDSLCRFYESAYKKKLQTALDEKVDLTVVEGDLRLNK